MGEVGAARSLHGPDSAEGLDTAPGGVCSPTSIHPLGAGVGWIGPNLDMLVGVGSITDDKEGQGSPDLGVRRVEVGAKGAAWPQSGHVGGCGGWSGPSLDVH